MENLSILVKILECTDVFPSSQGLVKPNIYSVRKKRKSSFDSCMTARDPILDHGFFDVSEIEVC